MLLSFKPVFTFFGLGLSSIIPLTFYVNDGVRREQLTWNSSEDCVFEPLSHLTLTLLECAKNKNSGKKYKLFLLKDYSNAQNGWNKRNNGIKEYKFLIVGNAGTLTPISSTTEKISPLNLEQPNESEIPTSGVNYEVFVQKSGTSKDNHDQYKSILEQIKAKLPINS